MTIAVDTLRTAARSGAHVADDEWLNGAREPAAGAPTSGRGRREQIPLPAAYMPTPVPLMRGARWPLILLEGPEYSRKTTYAFHLAATDLVGQTYVLAIGEDVDEFGELAPNALRLPHDGTWHQIMGCVQYVATRAQEALDAGGPPVYLIVDSMTKVWKLLSEWAENRAREANANREKLSHDPNAEIDIHPTFWTAANKRHERLVTALIRMPAIVVVTARAKTVAEINEYGNPTRNKVYKVESQRDLGFSTTAWVRLDRESYPAIVGLRRVRGGIVPTLDKPLVIDPRVDRFRGREFSLEWLLTKVLRFDPKSARPSTLVEPAADAAAPVSAPPAPGPADATEPAGAGPAQADVRPQSANHG